MTKIISFFNTYIEPNSAKFNEFAEDGCDTDVSWIPEDHPDFQRVHELWDAEYRKWTQIKLEDGFVKKIRPALGKLNYHFIRLMTFADCPRCSNQGLVMPLVKEENRYVCSMCGSVYQNE